MIYPSPIRLYKLSETKSHKAEMVRTMVKKLHSEKHIQEESEKAEDLRSIMKYKKAWREYLNELLIRSRKKNYANKRESPLVSMTTARDIGVQETPNKEKNCRAIDEDLTLFHKQSFIKDQENFKDEGIQVDTSITKSPKTDLSPKIWRNKRSLSPIDFFKMTNERTIIKVAKVDSPNHRKSNTPLSDFDNTCNSNGEKHEHSKSVKSVPRHVSFENDPSKEIYSALTPKLKHLNKPDLYENHKNRPPKIQKTKEFTENVKSNFMPKRDFNKFIEVEARKQPSDIGKKLNRIRRLKLSELSIS
ncbi:unnamed protein product [Blepharisma stoltei]|uniref:Uncharacterized protein n=1 Tax=Blepharisma stoltei TaxID=1481888 RepID=A0AAU9IUJ3_9CILI|nr:unnamed protein product [Blepharisma stoltei]